MGYCDHTDHDPRRRFAPAIAAFQAVICWNGPVDEGPGETTRYLCHNHRAELQRLMDDPDSYLHSWIQVVQITPLHFHVVNAQRFHPNNVWELRPDGLFEHTGSPYAFKAEDVRACNEPH